MQKDIFTASLKERRYCKLKADAMLTSVRFIILIIYLLSVFFLIKDFNIDEETIIT